MQDMLFKYFADTLQAYIVKLKREGKFESGIGEAFIGELGGG